MKLLGHPLFLVFAFSLLVCLAGIWWLLRQPREEKDFEQRASALREDERSVMEILQEVPPDTTPLDQLAPVEQGAVKLHKRDATLRTVMQEEAKTRLALMDELIGEQRSRIASGRARDLDVTLLEAQLKVLRDSHEEYFSALKRLLIDLAGDENAKGQVQ